MKSVFALLVTFCLIVVNVSATNYWTFFRNEFENKIKNSWSHHQTARKFKDEQFVNISKSQGKAVAPEERERDSHGMSRILPRTKPVKNTDSDMSKDYYGKESSWSTAMSMIRDALN